MNIEDLLLRTACAGNFRGFTPVRLGSPHWNPIHSLADQITNNVALTEKQSIYAVKLLSRYKTQLTKLIGHDISEYLLTPQYRLGIRDISQMKNVNISEDDNHIIVQFPYDLQLLTKIKEYQSTVTYNEIYWDSNKWIFSLKEEHIKFIADNLLHDEYTACSKFTDYLSQINAIDNNSLEYIPYVAYENNKFVYRNVHQSVAQPSTDNLLHVLFQAARAGIDMRDETVSDLISKSIDSTTLSILDNFGGMTSVSNYASIDCLKNTVSCSRTTMIIVPGGNELFSVRTFVSFFNKLGISNSNMAVLFRLSNSKEQNQLFNEYVKLNSLNNKLSADINVIFVMGKLPSEMLTVSPTCTVDTIINLGTTTPHYILYSYIATHPCVINYNIVNKSGELNFGNM